MNNEIVNNDKIELSLPANAAYVSAARLTASSVANRMRFQIDDIEDIKAAVSEACTYIIKKSPAGESNSFKISFHLQDTDLTIQIHIKKSIDIKNNEDEMSLVMINALMNRVEINPKEDGSMMLIMVKNHKKSSF